MDLDWCPDENLQNESQFNENSIISKEKKIELTIEPEGDNIIDEINVENCFLIDLNIKSNKNLLNILHYLSIISNYLRTFIRNKSSKFNEFNEITESEFELVIKYLNWLKDSSNSIKKYFAIPLRRDNSYDPNTIKLFKTSSYKFCNFKESCSIHKNKQSKCDKNHFVFDMIINDILKLIDSITIIEIHNFNWILLNKIIKITFDPVQKKYLIEKINGVNINFEQNDYQFVLDKTIIFKSFDVISYVLNKMYEESFYFLNYEYNSLLINL